MKSIQFPTEKQLMKTNNLNPFFCDVIPPKEKMVPGTLYISMKCDVAGHLCPCGCGEEVITMFHPECGWSLSYDGRGVTLSPSIGNWNSPCSSHYWIQRNRVIWCSEKLQAPTHTKMQWFKRLSPQKKKRKTPRKP